MLSPIPTANLVPPTLCHLRSISLQFPAVLIVLLIAAQCAAQSMLPQQQQLFQPQQPHYSLYPSIRPSLFDPILKAKSNDGFLPASASMGTFVRTQPSASAPPLQILVEDADLLPGMASAVYQYILTGYGAERFAVDQHGNLYLNADELDWDSTATPSFVLHIIAREVDTEPQRQSSPISIAIHVLDDDDEPPAESASAGQTIYVANVSALDTGEERVVAQVKAREEGTNAITYRIAEVSDNAERSFRYDHPTHELRAVGSLFPGHRYKVVIEAKDAGGLVGYAVVLVQALPAPPPRSESPPATPSLSPTRQQLGPNVLVPAPPLKSSKQLALIPSEHWPSRTGASASQRPEPASNGNAPPAGKNIVERVSEASPVGTLVTTLLGEEDQQQRGKVSFVLRAGNEAGLFGLDEESGAVFTKAALDRERKAVHKLRIEARSADRLLYVTNLDVEVVDDNDNSPHFEGPLALTTRLDEFSPDSPQLTEPNLLLGSVEVVDPDQGKNGKVTLQVMPPLDRLFSINDAGEVRVSGMLSSAHLGQHHLTVMAVDSGDLPRSSRAVLTVTIEGRFSSSVRETLLRGGPPPPAGKGTLPRGGPSGSIASSSSDYETPETDNHRSAVDSGDSTLQQRRGEANAEAIDRSPFTRVDPTDAQFASTSTLAPQHPHKGQPIFGGENGLLSSASAQAFSPQLFSANPAESIAPPTTQRSAAVSSEEVATPRLAPIFDSAELKVFVEENEEQMELTRLRAHWPDGGPGRLSYKLLAGDDSLFSVDPHTGLVTLLRALDAESERQPPVYRLQVGTAEAERDGFLTDPELAHKCELVIHVVDINDWIPNFEQEKYTFSVPSAARKGTIVGQVAAFDQDLTAPNNRVHYALVPPASQFRVDAESGHISVEAESMDEFAGRELALLVRAIDGGLEGTEQNSTVQVVVRVEGRKGAGQNEQTSSEGAVGPRKGRPPDAAGTRVGATTTGSTLSAPSGIGFSARQYNASLLEGQRPPVQVLTLEVVNKPRDTRFTMCAIRSGNFRGAFSIAPDAAGNCRLMSQVQLDREAIASYTLNISVESGGQSGTAVVNVVVLDANDNKPKFVFPPSDNDAAAPSAGGYFATLPAETEANGKFFVLKAEDPDLPANGSGVVRFELDAQSPDAQYFGVDPDGGRVWVRRKAREIAQLTRRDYFRITAIACDNPSGATRKCSRAPLAIALLDDRHKFTLLFAGMHADSIRKHENEIAQCLLPFVSPCSRLAIQRVDEQTSEDGHLVAGAVVYAANPREKKICAKHEFVKLFSSGTKEQLAAKMREWSAELLDVLGETGNSDGGKTSRRGAIAEERMGENGRGAAVGNGDGLVALLLPVDWSSTSNVLIAIAVAVAAIAMVGLCALFAFRTRHQQMRRRRAEQMRRRQHQRGFSNGLLALNTNKQASAAAGRLFASYASNVSNNLYAAGGAVAGNSRGIAVPFERSNKFYESQLLELPMGDDCADFAAGSGGLRFVGRSGLQENGSGIQQAGDQLANGRRQQTSDLLPPQPLAQPHRQQLHHVHQQQIAALEFGRRQTNSDNNLPNRALNLGPRRTDFSPNGGEITNQEGDFSIDESLYAANGQARCY